VELGDVTEMKARFEAAYRKRYSFLMPGRGLVAEVVSVEAVAASDAPREPPVAGVSRTAPEYETTVTMHGGGRADRSPVFLRSRLGAGDRIAGPAIIAEVNSTT